MFSTLRIAYKNRKVPVRTALGKFQIQINYNCHVKYMLRQKKF